MASMSIASTRPNLGTISKVWRAHCRRMGLSSKTASEQLRLLIRVGEHVKPKHPFDVTREEIEDWLSEINVSSATTRTYIAQLAGLYAYLADRFDFADPTAKLERPKPAKRLPKPILADAFSEVYARYAASSDLGDRRMRAILALIRLDGFRCSDVSALRGEGVDVVTKSLRVIGKGDKERFVPMHDEVWRAILGWRAPKRGLPVVSWLDDPTVPVSAGWVSKMVSDALGKNWTAHMGRHRFAADYYADSKDLRGLQAVLGHASLATTEIYIEADMDAASRVVGRLQV